MTLQLRLLCILFRSHIPSCSVDSCHVSCTLLSIAHTGCSWCDYWHKWLVSGVLWSCGSTGDVILIFMRHRMGLRSTFLKSSSSEFCREKQGNESHAIRKQMKMHSLQLQQICAGSELVSVWFTTSMPWRSLFCFSVVCRSYHMTGGRTMVGVLGGPCCCL